MEFTVRLGYSKWAEYNSAFLIEKRPVYGCCDPSDYNLFDKNSGNIIRKLGTYLYLTPKDENRKFIIALKDFNTIFITNLVTNKISTVKLPTGRLEYSLEKSQSLFAENLFEQPVIINNHLIIRYKFQDSKTENWKISTIKFDLK